MTERPILIPGPDHPIEIVDEPRRLLVRVGGQVIADSSSTLTLTEARYQPVHYVPRQDVRMTLLERTAHRTYCPFKGDCNYFSVTVGGAHTVNAAWSYERPHVSVARIREYVAFYPDRVDSITLAEF